MKKIVLISCVSKKLPYKAKARDLYQSTLFKYALCYAESLNPDDIFILSAKHGLLDLDDEIEPYDLTLNEMSASDVKEWAQKVSLQLYKRIICSRDNVLFLAGSKYRKHLIPTLGNYRVPLEGLPIGKQLQKLKSLCKKGDL